MFNVGDCVKFSEPMTDEESAERFFVVEVRDVRLLVEFDQSCIEDPTFEMRLNPTFVYLAEDMVAA